MSIEKIRNLIIEIYNLQKKEFHMRHDNKYRCENYDTFYDDYEKIRTDLINTRKLFIDECNNFVDYPKKTILCFDLTKKIKFEDGSFIGLTLYVPFIDKKEYFCLIALFENMPDYIFNWGFDKTEWMFH